MAEYSFDKEGKKLIMLIDADGKIGNGVQVRDMTTGVVSVLDSSASTYSNLSWQSEFEAFCLLKPVKNKDYAQPWNTILAFQKLNETPEKIEYDPSTDKSFPADMGISSNGGVNWTKELTGITFGIAEQKKIEKPKAPEKPAAKPEDKKPEDKKPEDKKPEDKKPTPTPPATTKPSNKAAEKPDVVIWHWKDERLQPMQQVQAGRDKNYTYSCMYYVADKKFVRHATDEVKSVSLLPGGNYALGTDVKPYEYMANLDGRRYSDVYLINPKSGDKEKILTKIRYLMGFAPTGDKILYYDDGQFYCFDCAQKKSINISAAVTATSFIDTEDDHNVDRPPQFPRGWSKDGKHVVLTDGWDLWQVNTDGTGGVNLTGNGKKDGIRYQSFSQYEPEPTVPGYDFAKKLYVSYQGEWTKQTGVGVIEPGKASVQVLLSGDYNLRIVAKARDAEVYCYRKMTSIQYPDVYLAGENLADNKKVTSLNQQQKDYHWSSGAKLVDYQVMGKRLQGALHLPANYEPGKKYPTIVYIYEKLSDGLHSYVGPNDASFNNAIYTSHGYAVFNPDIV